MRQLTLLLSGIVFAAGARAQAPLPEDLADTGLFLPGTVELRPDVLPFSPQYPLWSDGAGKRRWLYLPPGSAIDASRPDAWEFPAGTRLWKEFSHDRRIETRFIERLDDGRWRYAAYVWDDAGSAARLAPAEGIPSLPAAGAPGGQYPVPSREDCLACHEGTDVPVLGVSALQLSPERDPGIPHADAVAAGDVDLRELAARGLLRGMPAEMLERPPRIEADTPTARAALGYLHANCGHCHNDVGPLALLELTLAQGSPDGSERTRHSLVGRPSDFRVAGIATRVAPGRPDASVLALRMRSRDPLVQMPPLATAVPDSEGIALIEQWILNDLQAQQELPQ